jgi:hypothetical protein
LFPADLQMVNMSLRLLSKPNEDKLPTIFKVSRGQNGSKPDRSAQTSNSTHCYVHVAVQLSQSVTSCSNLHRLVSRQANTPCAVSVHTLCVSLCALGTTATRSPLPLAGC